MARSGIIYGDSGSLKTTAVKHFSHYIYEKTGKSTLLLSMDGGGWGPCQPEIDAGVILPYRCNTQVPLPLLRKISQGYWPEDSGETEISRTNLRLVNWEKFGGVAVEGVTSISQAIMRHLADKGIKTGEEATNQFTQKVLVDGTPTNESFAGNSRGHFGFTQNQMYSMVTNFNSLPCEYVLFTGLESRTEEDDRTPIYGPQIAGKKATALIPSWVGDCIHAQGVPVPRTIQVPDPADAKKLIDSVVVDTAVRMYFAKHPDPVTSIMFPAKPRVTPERIPELMKKWPGGYFEPGLASGFDDYLKLLDKLGASQADEVAAWRAKMDEKFGRGKAAGVAGGLAVGIVTAGPATVDANSLK
jgi:hypothetical protein